MKNRYEQEIMTFMGWLSNQGRINKNSMFGKMFNNLDKIIDNPDAEIDFVQISNNALVKNQTDYSLYFSVVELYNAIIDYYRFKAKYNLKDERLENALKDWDKCAHSKITLKDMLKIVKRNVIIER
jgi:Ca2+-binding EF-hand superfamily protein